MRHLGRVLIFDDDVEIEALPGGEIERGARAERLAEHRRGLIADRALDLDRDR
jgi:hypothetical protein